MIERLEKRRRLFLNFPAPLNGKFHKITIREEILRIALETVLTMPELDREIARDIAREALILAFPIQARRELADDYNMHCRIPTEGESEKVNDEVVDYLMATHAALIAARKAANQG